MALHIKKGDTVEIIAGEHKGGMGRVLRLIRKQNKVIVEGQNRKYKHVRQSRRYPQGGRVQVEQPIHISNVLPVNPKSSRGTRVRFALGENGGKRRTALDGSEIGVVRRVKT